MKENKQWGLLKLFGEEIEGEASESSVHTPQNEQTGEITQGTPAAGEQTDTKERSEAFRRLMEGEYKELFTAYFQETFNRRFREQKEMTEELERHRTLVRAAAEHFGVAEGDLLATIRAEDGKKNAPTASAAAQSSPQPTAEQLQRERQEAVDTACAEMEQRLLATIRARGLRPAENALRGGGPVLGGDTARLSRAQRAALADRAAKGERIKL